MESAREKGRWRQLFKPLQVRHRLQGLANKPEYNCRSVMKAFTTTLLLLSSLSVAQSVVLEVCNASLLRYFKSLNVFPRSRLGKGEEAEEEVVVVVVVEEAEEPWSL